MKRVRRVCGIDEAGRGPLMGPLVIAAVSLPDGMLDVLKSLGVKDSKRLSRDKREALHAFMTTHEDIWWASTHITSQEIDLRRKRNETLNDIESTAMLALARRLERESGPFEELQLDSIEVNTEKFKRIFQGFFDCVVAECGADERMVAVSAASIVAKVERDRAISELELEQGCKIGSGYPSDPVTKQFLKMYFSQHKKLPPFIRHTWDIKKSYT